MDVLVATQHLSHLGGSETFTYALIEELTKRLDITVEYFTFEKGFVSEKIENELGVSFQSKNSYDLILANHNTCVNKLYKHGFIIQTCHGIFPKLEQPSSNANAYVSISQEVQTHLAHLNLPSKIILNGINLERFKPVNEINPVLKTVLSLCHSKEANDLIQDICNAMDLGFIKAYKYDNPVWSIEEYINSADLVVGLGRSAYESFACGRPVVVYDNRKYFESYGDGYVKEILGFSIQNNCSGRYFQKVFSKNELIKEFNKYNAEDGKYFRDFANNALDIKKSVNSYLEYHKDLLLEKQKRRKRKIKKIASLFFLDKLYHSWLKLKMLLKKD